MTELVRSGDNTLDFLLGNGWYRGRLGFRGERAQYGDRLALPAQLEVTTTDGQVHVLATDSSWTARESEVLADDLYDGQRTDLRRRGRDWRPATGSVERPRPGGRQRGRRPARRGAGARGTRPAVSGSAPASREPPGEGGA